LPAITVSIFCDILYQLLFLFHKSYSNLKYCDNSSNFGLRAQIESLKTCEKFRFSERNIQFGEIADMYLFGDKLGVFRTWTYQYHNYQK